MKPDPSIRTRCNFESRAEGWSVCSMISVSAGVAGSFVQHIEARAVGAQNGSVLDMQKYPRMSQFGIAAVAGDCPVIDMDDFGRRRAGGGAVHLVASHPLWRGSAV